MTHLPALLELLARQSPRMVNDSARREAAVALLLVPSPDRFLLIERAERWGDPWSGHLACPGGRRDPVDATLLDTATRECAEEVGVDLSEVRRVGQLDDLAPSTRTLPSILVRPFLFLLGEEPRVTLNDEVASYAWITFQSLIDTTPRQSVEVLVAGARRQVDGYPLPNGVLWGLTERIVTPLLDQWRGLARE